MTHTDTRVTMATQRPWILLLLGCLLLDCLLSRASALPVGDSGDGILSEIKHPGNAEFGRRVEPVTKPLVEQIWGRWVQGVTQSPGSGRWEWGPGWTRPVRIGLMKLERFISLLL
ncbi:uncharacterized protein LOC128211846 [Mya arenaria]|uniref:uncharacterized protein LOC128211846 n=1 Tax=Mya arenaria TaxID=6604 RepID=UPI0022E5FFA4|nr:uncharacterized protein LOC128211846 [Mya arenaria]